MRLHLHIMQRHFKVDILVFMKQWTDYSSHRERIGVDNKNMILYKNSIDSFLIMLIKLSRSTSKREHEVSKVGKNTNMI